MYEFSIYVIHLQSGSHNKVEAFNISFLKIVTFSEGEFASLWYLQILIGSLPLEC